MNVETVGELQSAIAELRSGQTVLIAPGEYALSQTLRLRGGVSNVAIRGSSQSATDVVLTGRGMANADYGNVPHGFLVEESTDVLIADLTLRDFYYHAVQVQGEQGALRTQLYRLNLVDIGEQFVKVSSAGPPGPYGDDGIVACSNIEYTDHARSYYTNGVDVVAGRGWVIRDNVFRRIRGPEGVLAGPTILMWRNARDSVVERNWIIDSDRGIALGLSAPDPRLARDGNATYDHQDGIVRNNVFFRRPGLAGDVGITVNFASNYVVAHNTVVLNGTFPNGAIDYRFAASDGLIAHNLTDAPIWQRDGARGELLNNVTTAVDAYFADAATGDLHLGGQVVGVTDVAMTLANVQDDVDGDQRPQGSAPDIGADEWRVPHSQTPSPTTTLTITATPGSTGTIGATVTATTSATYTATTGATANATIRASATPTGEAPITWRIYIPSADSRSDNASHRSRAVSSSAPASSHRATTRAISS